MIPIVCNNNKGVSLIEVLISIFILAIGILGVLAVFPQGWMSSMKSDLLGRGAEILHKEMETRQAFIMNPCNSITIGTTSKTVYPSGQTSAQSGDAPFTVSTEVNSIAGQTSIWRITVTVTWPGNSAGITESIDVTRDENYKQGC